MWDLNARPHEITLKIKHVRFKDKYAEGEIPHEAKTRSGPILLTLSFPYVRDWLNLRLKWMWMWTKMNSYIVSSILQFFTGTGAGYI